MHYPILTEPSFTSHNDHKLEIHHITLLHKCLKNMNKSGTLIRTFLKLFGVTPLYILGWRATLENMLYNFNFSFIDWTYCIRNHSSCCRFALVGRRSVHALHINILLAYGILRFQIVFHIVVHVPFLEPPLRQLACKSFSIWYALLSKKTPFDVPRQIRKSLIGTGLNRIVQITRAFLFTKDFFNKA
jgi:hypothetical protein